MTINPKLLEPTLLWENPNPTSNFAAQTLTISNFSAFKYLFVEFKRDTTAYGTVFCDKVKLDSSGIADSAVNIGKRSRSFRFRENNKADFGGASPMDSTTENNSLCIPVRIYGTNIL